MESKLTEKRRKTIAWRAAAASGLWEHRIDLPDFSCLRKEFDRQKHLLRSLSKRIEGAV